MQYEIDTQYNSKPPSKVERYCLNGDRYKIQTLFYDNGYVERIWPYVNGKLHGENLDYYEENGKLAKLTTYQNDKMNGPRIEYFPDGQIEYEVNYLNGEKHGTQKRYFANGQLAHVSSYLNGRQHGECVFYYTNGNVYMSTNYSDGTMHGRDILYNSDGQIAREDNYIYGLEHGPYLKYYLDGKIECEANYVGGEKHGIEKRYYKNGQLASMTTYEYGLLRGERTEYLLAETGEYFLLCKNDHNVLHSLNTKHGKNEMFICDGKYFKIKRGNISIDCFNIIKKSKNLLVVELKWILNRRYVAPDDDHSKGIHYVDCFILVEDGNEPITHNILQPVKPYLKKKHKLFLEASLSIEYKTEEERKEKLSKITNMLT